MLSPVYNVVSRLMFTIDSFSSYRAYRQSPDFTYRGENMPSQLSGYKPFISPVLPSWLQKWVRSWLHACAPTLPSPRMPVLAWTPAGCPPGLSLPSVFLMDPDLCLASHSVWPDYSVHVSLKALANLASTLLIFSPVLLRYDWHIVLF